MQVFSALKLKPKMMTVTDSIISPIMVTDVATGGHLYEANKDIF